MQTGYTGLRVKVTVKNEYRQMIEEINEGENWSEFVEEFPFLKKFAALYRANFIPRGVVSYMPDSWEMGTVPYIATDGFTRGIDLSTGYWAFQCSLKNYDEEIEVFLKEVLPVLISDAEHIETLHENWEESVLHEYKDGKIEQKIEKTINWEESKKMLDEGKQIFFHHRGKKVPVDKSTTFNQLRSDYFGNFGLTVDDVVNGCYSAEERKREQRN